MWPKKCTDILQEAGCKYISKSNLSARFLKLLQTPSPLVYSWTAELSVNTDKHLPCSQSMTDVHTQFQWEVREVTYKVIERIFLFFTFFYFHSPLFLVWPHKWPINTCNQEWENLCLMILIPFELCWIFWGLTDTHLATLLCIWKHMEKELTDINISWEMHWHFWQYWLYCLFHKLSLCCCQNNFPRQWSFSSVQFCSFESC